MTITTLSFQHCEWEEMLCQAHDGLKHQGVWNLEHFSSHPHPRHPNCTPSTPESEACHLLAKWDCLMSKEEGFNMAHQCRTCETRQPDKRRFDEFSVMNQKQMEEIFVKKHMGFTMKEEGSWGESFDKNALGSAGLYQTVRWTQSTYRVNFPSLMDIIQPGTTHRPWQRNHPNKYDCASARVSVRQE